MDDIFIIGNWKSNGLLEDVNKWCEAFKEQQFNNKKIVICPPFPLLAEFRSQIIDKKLPFNLGAQNVSPFDEGEYTGEISARQLKDLDVNFVIVGHSERRKNFNENSDLINKKIQKLFDQGINPIVCVSNEEELAGISSSEKILVAYEVIEDIGTGVPADKEKVQEFFRRIKDRGFIPLYGGSISPDNVIDYISAIGGKGVVVGGESLSSSDFNEIIKNAK